MLENYFEFTANLDWPDIIFKTIGFIGGAIAVVIIFGILSFIVMTIYQHRIKSLIASSLITIWCTGEIYQNPHLLRTWRTAEEVAKNPKILEHWELSWQFLLLMLSSATAFALLTIIIFQWRSGTINRRNDAEMVKRHSPSESGQESNNLSAQYAPRRPEVTFANVAGMEKLKAELMEAYKDRVKKNGILLSGDPGNGKTFIAEAFAGELKWGFMPITIGDLKSRWIGQTTEQLSAVFAAAERNGKLILFFDECDSMLRNRDDMMGSNNAEDAQIVNTFLTKVADIRRSKDIIVIAATNYPDKLDSAAIRDGRFDYKIHIPNPDEEARRGLLKIFSREKGWVTEIEASVMERLVRRWEGFSVARIRSIAERILKNSKASGRKEVTLDDALKALRQIQGSLGDQVGEDTLTLKDGGLQFDGSLAAKLMTLASRLENIDEFERMGGTVPKGAVFWGPPGTGKTATAKSLAKTSGWAFLATTGSDLLRDNGGGIEKLIDKAADLRPCIVFIDEAEQALSNRSANPHCSIVVNTILAATDGTRALRDVFFIAATNHPDALDSAIIRGGRFSERFEFKAPEDDTVLSIVRAWLKEKGATTRFHESFTAEAIAEMLSGMSPADIKDTLQQAVNHGIGRIMSGDGEFVMLSDLEGVL